jgi:hypothetical protein
VTPFGEADVIEYVLKQALLLSKDLTVIPGLFL